MSIATIMEKSADVWSSLSRKWWLAILIIQMEETTGLRWPIILTPPLLN